MRKQFDVLTRSQKRKLRKMGKTDFVAEYHSSHNARKNRRWCRRELRSGTSPEIYSGITGRDLSKMWRSSSRFVLRYSRERSRIEWEEMSRHADAWYPYTSESE